MYLTSESICCIKLLSLLFVCFPVTILCLYCYSVYYIFCCLYSFILLLILFFILFLSPFYFLILCILFFLPVYFILLFIRLSCIYYGNLVVSAGLRCCPKQQWKSRVRIPCEVQGYNAMKNDCVAWCNLDPVGDHCQKSEKRKLFKKKEE